MKDRIRQIMESQHMTQQVFAQFIAVSPAMLSSIFNDRTKPSLNIVEAIKKKIPDISIDWLMFGTGTMYHTQSKDPMTPAGTSQTAQESVLDFDDSPSPTPAYPATPSEKHISPVGSVNSVKITHQNLLREEVKNVDKPPRRVTEIRVFYDDQTWESFVPAKK